MKHGYSFFLSSEEVFETLHGIFESAAGWRWLISIEEIGSLRHLPEF